MTNLSYRARVTDIESELVILKAALPEYDTCGTYELDFLIKRVNRVQKELTEFKKAVKGLGRGVDK